MPYADTFSERDKVVAADTFVDLVVERERGGVVAVRLGRREVVRGADCPFGVELLHDGEVLGVRVTVRAQVCEGELSDELTGGDEWRTRLACQGVDHRLARHGVLVRRIPPQHLAGVLLCKGNEHAVVRRAVEAAHEQSGSAVAVVHHVGVGDGEATATSRVEEERFVGDEVWQVGWIELEDEALVRPLHGQRDHFRRDLRLYAGEPGPRSHEPLAGQVGVQVGEDDVGPCSDLDAGPRGSGS